MVGVGCSLTVSRLRLAKFETIRMTVEPAQKSKSRRRKNQRHLTNEKKITRTRSFRAERKKRKMTTATAIVTVEAIMVMTSSRIHMNTCTLLFCFCINLMDNQMSTLPFPRIRTSAAETCRSELIQRSAPFLLHSNSCQCLLLL